MRRTVLVLSLLAAACSSGVQPTNPYDPATPPDRQAKAVVRGALAAPTLASPGGLTVFLRANHQIVKQVQTAADGAFLVDAIVPGSYAVEAAPQGFVPVGIPVTLAPGQELELGTLTLTPLLGVDAAIITGRVTLDSRTFHGGTLVEAVGRAFTAITDSSGAFRLEVSEGTYDLRMTHEAFKTIEVNALVVSRGEQRALAPVQLAGDPARIEGDVVAELPAGGQGPLADAVVSVEGTSQTGLTDTNGHFVLNGVTAGSYLVRVVKSGYEGVSTPVLNLAGGELRVLADPLALTLSRGGLAGRVALADAPDDASGCVVEVTGTGRAAVIGSDGKFAFDDLLAGTYELSARRDGYGRQVRSSLAVGAGATTQVGTVTLVRQGGSVAIAQGSYTLDRNVTLELGAASCGRVQGERGPRLREPGARRYRRVRLADVRRPGLDAPVHAVERRRRAHRVRRLLRRDERLVAVERGDRARPGEADHPRDHDRHGRGVHARPHRHADLLGPGSPGGARSGRLRPREPVRGEQRRARGRVGPALQRHGDLAAHRGRWPEDGLGLGQRSRRERVRPRAGGGDARPSGSVVPHDLPVGRRRRRGGLRRDAPRHRRPLRE